MAKIKFKELKSTIEKMMPQVPFPEIDLKSMEHPDFSETTIRKRLEEELIKVTNPNK